MADDLGERTEEATPKRRQESREEGKVAKSQDLSGAALLVLTSLALAAAAMWMLGQGRLVLAAILSGATVSDPLDPAEVSTTLRYVGMAGARAAAPILLVAWGAGLIAQISQIGWVFSPKALKPSLSKLNPLSGFKRIFGLSGVVKASLDVLKVLIVAVVVVITVRQHADQILVLPYLTVMQCLGTVGDLMFDLALRILAVLLLLGLIDFSYQRWKHAKDMRMTKQQVKDEMKQTEGDPDVKRRRLRMQRQIALQRISTAVPNADVVVTNPEHVAVAIRYEQEKMDAPVVIAKGADHLAIRIRQIAMRHAIPIVERKPLARALYKQVAVGQAVPPDFYAAVAEVLAYVYRMSGKMAG